LSLWERIKRVLFWDYYLIEMLKEDRALLEEALIANNMRREHEDYSE
jgi:hypothetical protein